MSQSNIKDWSTAAASNNNASTGGMPEGQAPSTVNDNVRVQMVAHRVQWEDAEWFNWGHTVGFSSASEFTATITGTNSASGTNVYSIGRRVKIYDASGGVSEIRYGSIISISAASANSYKVNCSLDSGAITSSISSVATGIIRPTNTSLPIIPTHTKQIFTSSNTWTKPANLRWLKVTVVGGGGGGGGSAATAGGQVSVGGGGGGGGYSSIWRTAGSVSATEVVTVGTGGAGNSGAAGSNGNTSSFGAHCSATGGNGGSRLAAGTGGVASAGSGGAGASGDVNGQGGDGIDGSGSSDAAVVGYGGAGGNSIFGGISRGQAFTSGSSVANGIAGKTYGGGGSGACAGTGQSAGTGGSGADGVVIVEEVY